MEGGPAFICHGTPSRMTAAAARWVSAEHAKPETVSNSGCNVRCPTSHDAGEPQVGLTASCHEPVTIMCICFEIRVDEANSVHLAGQPTSGSADESKRQCESWSLTRCRYCQAFLMWRPGRSAWNAARSLSFSSLIGCPKLKHGASLRHSIAVTRDHLFCPATPKARSRSCRDATA